MTRACLVAFAVAACGCGSDAVSATSDGGTGGDGLISTVSTGPAGAGAAGTGLAGPGPAGTGSAGTATGGAGGFGAGAGGGGGMLDPDLEPPVFIKTWGQFGTGPSQFIEPSSVELDAAGNVYVAGHENRLQKFTFDGQPIDIFGTAGTGPGQFNHPHGLALDRVAGLLYAGDQNNKRVQVFTTEGVFVRLWTDPQFLHIHDVGIDPLTGDIYVGDYESDIVQKFTDVGEQLLEFGGTGSFDGQFLGAWGISTDSTGRVYVADTGNKRVQVFTPGGFFLNSWSGFAKPTGVFVDASDRIYVCDSLNDAIVIFNSFGQKLTTWDLTAIVGSLSEPEDIIITADGKHMYLGDVLNHRVIYLQRQP
ncbi:NHL repeat-containing protein [Desulfobulbus sp. AH-315-M07]|nr:NHL repeat-containing protein [Desulfobulbus sp. AH-315-M07]